VNWLRGQAQAINTAFFGYGSPVTMGLFRILIGFLAFVNFAMLSIDFEAWFTERGYFPVRLAEVWADGVWRFNLLSGVTDDRLTAAVYLVVMLASLTTTVGLWTRVSTIVLFLGTVTLHHRSPDILHGGDYLLRAWIFLVMIAPSGRACSLDRLIALWKNRVPVEPEPVSLWPQRLVQYQLAIVYFTTVWQKSFGNMWWDGTATWYPLHLREFDRFPLPSFLENPPFIAASTYFTVFIELAMATLVFARPLRKWILLGGLLLHAGIEYRLNIPLFAMVITSAYVSHYSGEEVTAWAKRLGARLKKLMLDVSLPKGWRFRPGRGDAIQAMDCFGLITYRPGDAEDWRAETPAGKQVSPGPAILLRSPGSWGLAVWPPLWRRIWKSACDTETTPAPDDVEEKVTTHA